MSSDRRTQATRPHTDAIAAAAARTPLRTAIQGAKRGSVDSILVLAEKVEDSYASHASEILDALLSNLNRPPAITNVRHTMAAYTAMDSLSEVFQWYKIHGTTSPASRITEVRLHESLDNFVYWIKRLLDGCRAKPDQLQTLDGYDTISRFIYTLSLTPSDIASILAKNTTILSVAVGLATDLYKGSPIIHPRGRPSNPTYDHLDSATAVLFILSKENVQGLVEVITSGTACTPETFVERIIHRVRCFHSPSTTVERMSHLPEDVSEMLNTHNIISLTLQVMESDAGMRDLFMDAKVPEVYISALAKQLRMASRLPDLEREAGFLFDIVPDVIRLWGAIKAEGALARAEEMADGGMFSLMGSLVPYSQRTAGQTWSSTDIGRHMFKNHSFMIGRAFTAILMYALYPKVLSKSIASVEKYVMPHLGELPLDSPYRGMITGFLNALRNCERLLSREQQEPLCDNMNHSATRSANSDGPPGLERVCAGCHSVAYCSRRCQKEDWDTFHRDECHAMRVSYFERKASKRLYPYAYRRLHANMLRYSFESIEVRITTLGPIGAANHHWRSYSPRKVNNHVDPLRVMDRMETFCTDLDAWVGREAPMIPEYLRPRFDAFLRAFVGSFKVPEYNPGSLRLVARVSPLGSEDVTMILLLRQTRPMLTMQGSQFQLMEMVRRFTLREPRAKSNFEIVGSFAFVGPCRPRGKGTSEF